MSAIYWHRRRDFEGGGPPCDGLCKTTKSKTRGTARYRLLLMGRPAGDFCTRCMRVLDQAWHDALPDREVEGETPVLEAAA